MSTAIVQQPKPQQAKRTTATAQSPAARRRQITPSNRGNRFRGAGGNAEGSTESQALLSSQPGAFKTEGTLYVTQAEFAKMRKLRNETCQDNPPTVTQELFLVEQFAGFLHMRPEQLIGRSWMLRMVNQVKERYVTH